MWPPAATHGKSPSCSFMVAHGKLDITVADMASRIDDDARNRLY
jgi:hypothetical protein